MKYFNINNTKKKKYSITTTNIFDTTRTTITIRKSAHGGGPPRRPFFFVKNLRSFLCSIIGFTLLLRTFYYGDYYQLVSTPSSSSSSNNKNGNDLQKITNTAKIRNLFTKEKSNESNNASSSAAVATTTMTKEKDAVDNDVDRKDNNNNYSSPPFYWSACMITKDEDMALPEWLAYHMTVLPLRRFVLGLDPESKFNPRYILEEFKVAYSHIMDFEYTIWEYDDYIHFRRGRVNVPGQDYNYSHYSNGTVITDRGLLYKSHLHRQNVFYEKCLTTLREENTTEWTLTIDADEFITYNPYIPTYEIPAHVCGGRRRTKNKRCIEEYHASMRNYTSTSTTTTTNNNRTNTTNTTRTIQPPHIRWKVPHTTISNTTDIAMIQQQDNGNKTTSRFANNNNRSISSSASFLGGNLVWTKEQLRNNHIIKSSSSSEEELLPLSPPKTMAHYLNQYMDDMIVFNKEHYSSPCWGMQRLNIGAHEPQHDYHHSKDEKKMKKGGDDNDVSFSSSSSFLYTLRYRLTPQLPMTITSKCMVNLRRFINGTIKHRGNPHAVIGSENCYNAPYASREGSVFRIHHYRSSLEDFVLKEQTQSQQSNTNGGQKSSLSIKEAIGNFYTRQSTSERSLFETWDATWWWNQFVSNLGNNITEAKRLTIGLKSKAKRKYISQIMNIKDKERQRRQRQEHGNTTTNNTTNTTNNNNKIWYNEIMNDDDGMIINTSMIVSLPLEPVFPWK